MTGDKMPKDLEEDIRCDINEWTQNSYAPLLRNFVTSLETKYNLCAVSWYYKDGIVKLWWCPL